MKGVDIFAYNDTHKNIDIEGLSIPPQGGVSVQVKRATGLMKPPTGVDYLVGLKVKNTPNCFDSTWIIQSIETSEDTKKWLKRSLNWLPEKYLSSNGLF